MHYNDRVKPATRFAVAGACTPARKGLVIIMLFYHARILSMEGAEYEDGWLLTASGKIKRLGSMESLPESAEGVDLGGGVLLPGFVDAHCHVGMFGDSLSFEGADGNEPTDPVTPHLRALDAVDPYDRCFSEALDAGVTTVLTGPGSTNPIAGEWIAMKTWGGSADERALLVPAGMKFALGENPKNNYGHKSHAPYTRMGTAALIREMLQKASRYKSDLLRAEADGKFEPPEYDAKCEALLPVLRREQRAYFHAHRADDIQTAVRIATEFDLDYAIVHATDGARIADWMAQRGVRAILGPILSDRGKPELRAHSIATAAALFEAGVSIAICTDHPENPIQYLPLEAALCVKGGLPREAALRGITIEAARIAGLDRRVGSLAPGKDADFQVYAPGADPLDLQSSPRLVFVDGNLVKGELPPCGILT